MRRAMDFGHRSAKQKNDIDKPHLANIVLLSPYAEEVAHIVVEEGIKVVTTGADNPGKYMEMWKAAGIKVPVVAKWRWQDDAKAGADAVVAEGARVRWSYRIRDNHDTGSAGCRCS